MPKLAKAQMSITGKIDITDNSDEILLALQKQIPNALEAIGGQAEDYAKEDCPVDTGRLRNSISHAVDSETNTVYIGTNVDYAPPVEYTDMSHKVGKAHFLRDAATTHGEDYKKIVEATLKV